MVYKVLVIKNRYTKKLDFSKGIKYFESIPLTITIEEISTDLDLSFKPVGNDTYNGVVATGFHNDLRKVVPEGKYNAVCLVYGNKAPGIRVSYADDPLYQDTDVIQVIKLSDRGLTFNHELFHAFFKKLARRGIYLNDPMDKVYVNGEPKFYYFDRDLSANPSNRTFALESIKPYWNVVTSFTNAVTLTRNKDNGTETVGTLTASIGTTSFSCKTLELPWRDNQKNISSIPKGTYDVIYSFSPKFMKYTYEILGVPNRSGIRIHSANFVSQLNGCVALGNALQDINSDGQLDVINSRITISAFETLMNKKPFKLNII